MSIFEKQKALLINEVLKSEEVIELHGGDGMEPITDNCKINTKCTENEHGCGIDLNISDVCLGGKNAGNCPPHWGWCMLSN